MRRGQHLGLGAHGPAGFDGPAGVGQRGTAGPGQGPFGLAPGYTTRPQAGHAGGDEGGQRGGHLFHLAGRLQRPGQLAGGQGVDVKAGRIRSNSLSQLAQGLAHRPVPLATTDAKASPEPANCPAQPEGYGNIRSTLPGGNGLLQTKSLLHHKSATCTKSAVVGYLFTKVSTTCTDGMRTPDTDLYSLRSCKS